MAGTLFGLPLSQQADATGTPISGGLLYIYDANTSTPSQTFSDFSLSTLQTFPIELDSAGRIPSFYVDDGSYRARLTTSAGIEVFDEQSITSIGASAGSSGSSSSIDDSVVFQTGDVLWNAIIGTRSGWVRANGRTVGSGASSATERANGDTQALFEYLWNNFSNTLCPVSGGRGATATADFNANKAIGTIDLRGRALFGLSDMGNSDSSRLTAGTPTAISTGGAEKQTIATGNLPSHTHTGTTDSGGVNHTHSAGSFATQGSQNAGTGNARNEANSDTSKTTGSASAFLHTHTFTTDATGSGTALATTPPYMLGTWYLKL